MKKTAFMLLGFSLSVMACGAESGHENPEARWSDNDELDLMGNVNSRQQFNFNRQGFTLSQGTIDNVLGDYFVNGEAQVIDSSRAMNSLTATMTRQEDSMAMAVVAINGINDEAFTTEGLTTTFVRDEDATPPDVFFGLTACAGPSSGFNTDATIEEVSVTVDEINDAFRTLSVESDVMKLTLRIESIEEVVEEEARPRGGD